MKKILLILTCLSTFYASAQSSEFALTKEGFTDFIVVNVDNKTANELYTKTNEWINKTYNNPKEVIKADIKDDYIRFEGIKSNLYCYAPLGMPVCYDVKYQIEVSFKDNKYKFDIVEMQEYVKPSQYSSGGWRALMSDNNTEFFFKKDGTLKGGFKNYVPNIPAYFNDLNKSLLDYINNTGFQAKKSDW